MLQVRALSPEPIEYQIRTYFPPSQPLQVSRLRKAHVNQIPRSSDFRFEHPHLRRDLIPFRVKVVNSDLLHEEPDHILLFRRRQVFESLLKLDETVGNDLGVRDNLLLVLDVYLELLPLQFNLPLLLRPTAPPPESSHRQFVWPRPVSPCP